MGGAKRSRNQTDPAESKGPSPPIAGPVSAGPSSSTTSFRSSRPSPLLLSDGAGILTDGGSINVETDKAMALTIEQERQQLEADEARLADRRKKLAERERKERLRSIEQSGLLKVDGAAFEGIMKAMKSLGMDEVAKRLTA